jgi:hypothetical protein
MLIGITGLAGSGKSEVARVLMDEFGFARVKFADPLKNMARALIREVGHTAEDVERYVEGDLKECEVDGLGITARWLMQSLGTEWGRDTIRSTFWTDIFREKASALHPRNVLADDMRFENEVQAVRNLAGITWRVERPGIVARDHPSERFVAELEVDATIYNSGTLDDLRLNVVYLVQQAMATDRIHESWVGHT